MNFIKDKNRIYSLDENNKVIAEVTFPNNGDKFVIDHTFVDDSLRGQGVAGTLVSMAVEEIHAQNGRVSATCPYASKWLLKNNITE